MPRELVWDLNHPVGMRRASWRVNSAHAEACRGHHRGRRPSQERPCARASIILPLAQSAEVIDNLCG